MSQILVGDWMRLIPFGVTVGGLSYLSLKGLANTPVVGPYIQVRISWYIGHKSYLKIKNYAISSKFDQKPVFGLHSINVK